MNDAILQLAYYYRYPSLKDQPVTNITLTDKKGRVRNYTVPIPSKQWLAAYY